MEEEGEILMTSLKEETLTTTSWVSSKPFGIPFRRPVQFYDRAAAPYPVRPARPRPYLDFEK